MSEIFNIPDEYKGNKRDKSSYIENDSAAIITAMAWALRSKDPSTQVGACFLNERGRVISVGYNGTPNGWNDDDFTWDKPKQTEFNKYTYVVHAEMNAISNYMGNVQDFRDSSIYVTLIPCPNCAKNLIQFGVKKVVYLHEPKEETPDVKATKYMFERCNVECIKFNTINLEKINNVMFDINSESEKNFSDIKKLGLNIEQ